VSQSIITLINTISDAQAAKLRMTLGSGEPVQLDCIFKMAEAPLFRLVFPPKKAIPEELEVNQSYTIEIVTENSPLIYRAVVESFHDNHTIEMRATDHIDPASSRDLPRVELSTTIIAASDPNSAPNSPYWEISGSTIDLSGTGVLCIFPKELENNSSVIIEIELPSIDRQVQCAAKVVRTRKLRKERYQTALHFDPITRENSESLLAACLQEQRNQLRQQMDDR